MAGRSSSSSNKEGLITSGNDTFDRFLGGGFVNQSVNLFERKGPSSTLLDTIWYKSQAAATVASKSGLIYVNFNSIYEIPEENLIASLPQARKVKAEMMFKDIRGKTPAEKIKIAWRYTNINANPSDILMRMNQLDFGISMSRDWDSSLIGRVKVLNIKQHQFNMKLFFKTLEREVANVKGADGKVSIIIADLLTPFSEMIDDSHLLLRFVYGLRCFARNLETGIILLGIDVNMCLDHARIKNQLYNFCDSVISFYSYETGQNRLIGYKNSDGTLEFKKVPKINSFNSHFQREVSDWGYRITKNHRFFVVDELDLPPAGNDDGHDKDRRIASELAALEPKASPLEQVGPLEDFKDIALRNLR